jgi:hypothetical protein
VTLGQVGLAFRPAWTKAIVIISEVLTKLPLWAMFHYTLTILDTLKPIRCAVWLSIKIEVKSNCIGSTSVVLLDTYPVATYITAAPVSFQDAPIRYLSTSSLAASLVSAKYHSPSIDLSLFLDRNIKHSGSLLQTFFCPALLLSSPSLACPSHRLGPSFLHPHHMFPIRLLRCFCRRISLTSPRIGLNGHRTP